MNPYKVLVVVDDDKDMCEILQLNLEIEGYIVDVAYSAEQALEMEITSFHLLIIDITMGEISGFNMVRIIRNNPKTFKTRIIFLTVRNTESDRLTGFAIGCDDYITKPFSITELLARIKVVVKMEEIPEGVDSMKIQHETLVMNLKNKKVSVDNIAVNLTKNEFEILRLFLENRNQLFSRKEILARVWKNEQGLISRIIDVNITRLRKKIGQYGKNITTRLGYGYCFEG